MGDDLLSNEISGLLSCEPTASHYKGQEITAKKSGRTRIARFEIDLLVGLMMPERNEGCVLSRVSMRHFGERGIALGLDIYADMND